LQMFFWYFAVFLNLPGAREASAWYAGLIVTNQGAFVPWPTPVGAYGPFLFALLAAVALAGAAYLVGRRRAQGARFAVSTFVVAAVAGVAINGIPFALSYPELGRFRITGGATLSPEFVAVLLALVI